VLGEAKAREAEAKLHQAWYADAFAAELAIEHSAWLVTADPEFAKVGNRSIRSRGTRR